MLWFLRVVVYVYACVVILVSFFTLWRVRSVRVILILGCLLSSVAVLSCLDCTVPQGHVEASCFLCDDGAEYEAGVHRDVRRVCM